MSIQLKSWGHHADNWTPETVFTLIIPGLNTAEFANLYVCMLTLLCVRKGCMSHYIRIHNLDLIKPGAYHK